MNNDGKNYIAQTVNGPIKKNDLGADVVSIGELMKALKAGIKPQKIVFSGVGKTNAEIEYAIRKNILLILKIISKKLIL